MQIPSLLVNKLLIESPAFRQYVIDLLDDPSKIKEQVRKVVAEASGKIDAIKKVTAIFEYDKSAFIQAYPDADLITWSSGARGLGLSWRKKLVESLRDF